MRQLFAQFMKFALVGTIAFLIDYGFMIFLTELFGVPFLISTTVSFVLSVIFNYFASMRFVFERKDDMSRKREFIIFVALSAFGLALNDLFMWLTVDFLYMDYRIAKILVTMLVSVYNFVSRKLLLEEKSA